MKDILISAAAATILTPSTYFGLVAMGMEPGFSVALVIKATYAAAVGVIFVDVGGAMITATAAAMAGVAAQSVIVVASGDPAALLASVGIGIVSIFGIWILADTREESFCRMLSVYGVEVTVIGVAISLHLNSMAV